MLLSNLRSPRRKFVAEWLLLLSVLIAFGGYFGYSQHHDYITIAAAEGERLAQQTLVSKRNMIPQLRAARRAMDGVLFELSLSLARQDDMHFVHQRLALISDPLPGLLPRSHIGDAIENIRT